MPPSDLPAQPPASLAVSARPLRFGAAQAGAREIEVAVETPINIVYGTMPYAVMMASPSDLEDFVTGFSLTEGIVRGADEIRSIRVEPKDEGVVVTVELAPGRFREHLARRRNLSGRTELPIAFWDERLSTAAVTRTLLEADASRGRRAEVVDKMAAAYILQGALDRLSRLGPQEADEERQYD